MVTLPAFLRARDKKDASPSALEKRLTDKENRTIRLAYTRSSKTGLPPGFWTKKLYGPWRSKKVGDKWQIMPYHEFKDRLVGAFRGEPYAVGATRPEGTPVPGFIRREAKAQAVQDKRAAEADTMYKIGGTVKRKPSKVSKVHKGGALLFGIKK